MYSKFIVVSLYAFAVNAHMSLFDATPGGCRMNSGNSNNPVKDVSENDIVCGPNSISAASFCDVQAGGGITFHFGHNSMGDDVIADSHKGPCNAWMAKMDGSSVPTDGWFKIWQRNGDGQWCTEELIASRGQMEVPIPSGVPSGKYVVRFEALALHEGNRPGGSQFYMGCAAVTVSGGSGSLPTDTVSIPGHLSGDSPGVVYDIYSGGSPGSFPDLGGPVQAMGAGAGAGGASTMASSIAKGDADATDGAADVKPAEETEPDEKPKKKSGSKGKASAPAPSDADATDASPPPAAPKDAGSPPKDAGSPPPSSSKGGAAPATGGDPVKAGQDFQKAADDFLVALKGLQQPSPVQQVPVQQVPAAAAAY